MPRSAVDATRFTPTGPYANGTGNGKQSISASASPSPSLSSSSPTSPLQFADPAPPNETPQQKVARLREAARRARAARITPYDKVVLFGRVWADRLHRGTVVVVVGATCMSFQFQDIVHSVAHTYRQSLNTKSTRFSSMRCIHGVRRWRYDVIQPPKAKSMVRRSAD